MSVLVGRKAPDFRADAVLGNGEFAEFQLSTEIKGQYGLLFFYPLDFTFVCPSELIALDNRFDEFKKRNVLPMSVSIDSKFAHYAWRNTPIKEGGIGSVRYPMIADTKHDIARAYDVEHPEAGIALRGAFLIDKEQIVRAQIVNDLPLGRNIDELLRLIDALQFVEEHGEVCPAGWNKGDTAIKATNNGIANFLEEHAEAL